MSFRFRVLGLVMLVALSATGATAWLTLRQARQQLSATASADQAQIDMISSELRAYASRQGTWEGVPTLVQRLHRDTGQRIHLETDVDVVVDTDTEENPDRATRPLGPLSALVNPRPTLSLAGVPTAQLAASTVNAIGNYRSGILLAACLTRSGVGVTTTPGALGVPAFEPTADDERFAPDLTENCRVGTAQAGRDTEADLTRTDNCIASKDSLPAPNSPDRATPDSGSPLAPTQPTAAARCDPYRSPPMAPRPRTTRSTA